MAASQLVLDLGQPTERIFVVGVHPVGIGRGAEETVSLQDASLSRQHARITVEAEGTFVTDLQSKNGTFVNEKRVSRSILQHGDLVRCGQVRFRYLSPTPQPQTKTQTPSPTLVCDIPKHDTGLDELRRLPTIGVSNQGAADRAHTRLQILLRVGEVLSEPGNLTRTLDRILALLFEILDVNRAAILLVDAQSGEMTPAAVRSSTPLRPGEQVWSRHVVELVRNQGVAALFGNAQEDARLDTAKSIAIQSIFASMCMPLKPREEIIGVLYVDNVTTPNRFGEDDLRLLAGFGNQAALAIHNARLLQELQRKVVLENNLMRFFPKAVRERLIAAPAGLTDTVETVATVLFADITGFTTLASQMRPREVLTFLNAYFPVVAEAVFEQGGTLEKYIGDAVLAVWGAPFSADDDAQRAVLAAIQIERRIQVLSREWESRIGAPLNVHIGLHTGVVAAGNIGVESYLQYATIGDATNLASRVSTAAGPNEIIVSEATRKALGDHPFVLTKVGPILLKGYKTEVDLYRVDWRT